MSGVVNVLRSILSRAQKLVWSRLSQRTPGENAFLLLFPVVGVVVGVTSVLTAHVITFLQATFWGSGRNLLSAADSNPPLFHIVIPLIGGLLVGVMGWFFRVNTRGGGITTIMNAVALKGGYVSLRETLPRDWSAIITISTGGSLGREGAMALLATAIGSNLGRRFHLTTQQLRVLVCAAAAAALAAVYNAPIGGSLFALEILMGNFALDVLGPVVVVSVISTLVFRSCMGSLPRFEAPHYEFVSAWELLPYLVLGLLAGVAALVFKRALFGSQDIFEKLPLPKWLKPAIGMTLVGVIALRLPHVYGNGFEAVNLTLREQLPIKLLLFLIPAKLVASSLTYGSGGAGGLFTPSLMLGALVGGAFGYGVHDLFPTVTAEHGAYALVGMGGVLAGMTHAPLTAIMMIFEQTNNYQIVLPLMFVCIISHFTTRIFKAQSFEEQSLQRRGVILPRGPEASVMHSLRVSDVMHDDVEFVKANDAFPTVVERFVNSRYNNLYVVDDAQHFLGAIPLFSLKEMLSQSESLKSVVAVDLLVENFDVVTPDQQLADTMEIFWHQNSERLPVVSDTKSRRLIGWISKRDLIGIYREEILQKDRLLGRFGISDDAGRREAFVELPPASNFKQLFSRRRSMARRSARSRHARNTASTSWR